MNELSTTTKNLPETIEEKAKYVLFGFEALKIYRAKLEAMKKAGISKEQYDQLELEAQETAENVLMYSVDIGEYMSGIEQAKGNRYSSPSASGSTKQQAIHKMGFTDRQARDFQAMAKHPKEVEAAKKEARDQNRIVTRQDVLNRIITPKRGNPLKEVSKEAWKNHMKAVISPVVDMEDIKKDQENKELILTETELKILKIISDCSMVDIIPDKDIAGVWKKKTELQKTEFQNRLFKASRTITHVLSLSEE